MCDACVCAGDLVAQVSGQGGLDVADAQKGRPLRSMHSSNEDLADPHDLNNPMMPPPLNPAAALANAQLAAQSSAAALGANPLKPTASLQNPSSLTAPSINPLLQRHLSQQVGKQPAPPVNHVCCHFTLMKCSILLLPLAVLCNGFCNQCLRLVCCDVQMMPGIRATPQQYHNQLTQQLQLAVQTGLVSPSLLNQGQLAPNILVMLEQLLQLSQLLQRLHIQYEVSSAAVCRAFVLC